MDSLANYGSDDEVDSGTISNVNGGLNSFNSGVEGDNYDDVQMDMSENPLNGSKAPSVQAFPQGLAGGALPNCATIESDSNCDSVKDDEDKSASEQHERERSSSSSPASAISSDRETSTPKNEPISEKKDSDSRIMQNQDKRDQESHGDRDRHRDREAEDRDKDKHREQEDRDRDRREDRRRSDRHRSRSHSRDRKERRKSPVRRSRDLDTKRRLIREHRVRESDRKYPGSRGRDYDRKKHRSRSRSAEKHHASRDSRRSSSSSGSCKSDARSRENKVQPTSSKRSSRSRSRSIEKARERSRCGDSREIFLEKKINRKMNVLERMGIELKPEMKLGATGLVTPQMLVQRTMEQQAAQVKQATGVELPSYYNAAAVNAHRLVDQIQKRKLLWGSKKEEQASPAIPQPSANKWQGATFAQDEDGKLTAKFNRLMGIKQLSAEQPNTTSGETKGSEIIKKQEEMFHNMESQYEVARLATHTHRGLGLGFGTFQPR